MAWDSTLYQAVRAAIKQVDTEYRNLLSEEELQHMAIAVIQVYDDRRMAEPNDLEIIKSMLRQLGAE